MRGPESTFIVPAAAADGAVDRAATVGRHLVRLRTLDPRSPLQVGNGEFAIAVDPTGLQTFPEKYPVEGGGSLLGTMAQWAWHSLPSPRTYSLVEAIRDYVTPRGSVPYVDLGDEMHDGASQTEAETWLRGNPHKLQLATIGLWTGDSTPLDAGSLSDIDQQLDLWSGIVESRFALAGGRYSTTTAAHPERDAVAFKLTGPPGAPLGVRLRFPYGSDAWADASDWTKPEAHTTQVERLPDGWLLTRRLDETSYQVLVRATGSEMQRLGEHDLVFSAAGEAEVVIEFVRGAADRRLDDETPSDERPKDESPPDEGPSDECPSGQPRPASNDSLSAAAVLAASSRYWASFWSSGAFVDLSGSSDRRACELERRIVLSQYLTAVNCAGSLPPAETGLLLNSWRGKFHLEMHIFHALHFAAWGRPQLLERSLGWYLDALKVARETAVRQGYDGARWPKQVGPAGQETPSSIGPFLVWQQPHLIYLLEMLYRAEPGSSVLERYADLIHDTAEFMASFAHEDEQGFHLGPPIVPAQESYASTRAGARDPTFELAYWSWALTAAANWWERSGRSPPARWRAVANGMAPALVKDGTYAALATPPYLVRDDHPSMLAAFGLVPATTLIDPEVMSETFDAVMVDWRWESTWGWDYPLAAMTAARLGRPADAVDALLLDRPKNTYLANGHNRQTERLPVYLPGNGGLLLAIALLVGGWDAASGTPGSHGAAATLGTAAAQGLGPGWSVAHEGFIRLP